MGKKRRVGVIHAALGAAAPLGNALKGLEDVEVLNFIDENLSAYAKANGVDARILREFSRVLGTAVEAGSEVIVIGCSIFCAYVPLFRELSPVPLLPVDEPMMKRAGSLGGRIALLATNETTVPTSVKSIERAARCAGKSCQVTGLAVPEADAALKRGEGELFDRLLLEAGEKLKAEGAEAIVLAQLTMDRAKEPLSALGLPILSSPAEAAKAVQELLK